jgi:hypothetical protein
MNQPAARHGVRPQATASRRRRQLLVLSAAAPLLIDGARANTEPGAVVLTISGKVKLPDGADKVRFDMATLQKLPQHSFTTMTPWYAQPRKFTGPLLRDVLALAGVRSGSLKAVALNDYRVTIPVGDALRFDVIVARLLDDKPMPIRDKGPLFIIYPFDQVPELRNAIYYSRSAWQLKALEVS